MLILPFSSLFFSLLHFFPPPSSRLGGYYPNDEDDADEMQGGRLAHTMSTHSMSRSGSRDRGDRDRDRDRDRGDRDSQKRPPRSTPGEGSRGAQTPHDLMEVFVRPLSTYATEAMSEVADRFYNKACEVSDLLDSALGADPSNFKKVCGSQIL
jgi:hypothetical protein